MAQVQKTLPIMTNVKLGARGLQNMCCPKWCRISSVNSKEFWVAAFQKDCPDVSITRV